MDVAINIEDDSMIIQGVSNLKAAVLNSRQDHRIAMVCAVASFNANEPVTITNAKAMNKSCPNFYQHLKHFGVALEIEN